MSRQFTGADSMRKASFRGVDLTGATFRGCDFNDIKVVGSEVNDLRIDGHAGYLGRIVVNGVEVTSYVMGELDRRFPERVQLRALQSADDFRHMWQTVENLWANTVAQAQQLPEAMLHERVDDEWSLVETLRHLVFAIDVWVGRMLNAEDLPYHRLGLPTGSFPRKAAIEIGLEPDAAPSFDEVLVIHTERRSQMSLALASVTDTELNQPRTASPVPMESEETVSVRECLFTVLEEHCEHRRYALRDLEILQAR